MEQPTEHTATNLICIISVIGQTYQIHDLLPTECDGGLFGNHCNKSCGKCHNDEQCHHVNGSCLNGCRAGYHGVTCTKGKHIIR